MRSKLQENMSRQLTLTYIRTLKDCLEVLSAGQRKVRDRARQRKARMTKAMQESARQGRVAQGQGYAG